MGCKLNCRLKIVDCTFFRLCLNQSLFLIPIHCQVSTPDGVINAKQVVNASGQILYIAECSPD